MTHARCKISNEQLPLINGWSIADINLIQWGQNIAHHCIYKRWLRGTYITFNSDLMANHIGGIDINLVSRTKPCSSCSCFGTMPPRVTLKGYYHLDRFETTGSRRRLDPILESVPSNSVRGSCLVHSTLWISGIIILTKIKT